MMKTMKKWSVMLFSLVMVLSLAVPALAAPAERYALLNVRFAPNGTGVNSTESSQVEYKAYKLADVAVDGEGQYTYTVTSAFAGANINVAERLGGKRVNDDSDAYKQLLSEFGAYINAHAGELEAFTATTGTKNIGTSNTATDGVAQFTGLTNGLYLVTTNASVWIGGTRYTPVPFLVSVPYVDGDVTNNYITATVKFTTYTPSGPSGPTDPPLPTAPVDPPLIPTEPDVPADPDTPDEPEIEILPEDVPLAEIPEVEDMTPEIEIPEEDVPLAQLPQTGLLWWPVPVMAAAGTVLIVAGVVARRKENRDA